MSALSPISRIPLPTDDDILDYNGICGNFANFMDTVLVPRYSSTAARDAAHASGSTVGEIIAIAEPSGAVKLQTYTVAGWATVEDIETAYKQTSTARSSTSTPAPDPDLKFTLVPNSTYIIKGRVSYHVTSPTPDVKFRWGVTGSGLTCIARCVIGGHDGVATGGEPGFQFFGTSMATDVEVGLIDNSRKHFEVMLYVTTGSSSVLIEYSWAQRSSNAAVLTLLEGSFMEANRVG